MKLYLARDKRGYLYIHVGDKPFKYGEHWLSLNEDNNRMLINSDTFPEVKWEDEEPTEVELVIKK